jgi:hypothetical protein
MKRNVRAKLKGSRGLTGIDAEGLLAMQAIQTILPYLPIRCKIGEGVAVVSFGKRLRAELPSPAHLG